MNQNVDNAIGGYEDCHLVNSTKHTDEMRGTFNEWYKTQSGLCPMSLPAKQLSACWQACATRYQDALRGLRGDVKALALTDSPGMRAKLGTDIIATINKLLPSEEA